MTSRPLAFVLLALLGLAVVPAASAKLVTVQMTTVDFEPRFVPAEITVEPGDTVRWINTDPFLLEHAVSSGTGEADPQAGDLFASGMLRSNEYFEYTFDVTGDFDFFSPPHEFEGMFGVVHVTTILDTGGRIETSTWGRLKAQFDGILPRD